VLIMIGKGKRIWEREIVTQTVIATYASGVSEKRNHDEPHLE